MKSKRIYIFFLLFSLLFFFACESSKSVHSKEVISKIKLEKSTLGSNSILEITEGKLVSSSTQRNGSTDSASQKISTTQWNELNRLIGELDLSQIDRWEGPTQARFYDGAMATTIVIESGNETYTSQSFDEGEPPAELKNLYDYLESLVNQ